MREQQHFGKVQSILLGWEQNWAKHEIREQTFIGPKFTFLSTAFDRFSTMGRGIISENNFLLRSSISLNFFKEYGNCFSRVIKWFLSFLWFPRISQGLMVSGGPFVVQELNIREDVHTTYNCQLYMFFSFLGGGVVSGGKMRKGTNMCTFTLRGQTMCTFTFTLRTENKQCVLWRRGPNPFYCNWRDMQDHVAPQWVDHYLRLSIGLKYQLENAAKLKVTNIALVFRLYQDAEVWSVKSIS